SSATSIDPPTVTEWRAARSRNISTATFSRGRTASWTCPRIGTGDVQNSGTAIRRAPRPAASTIICSSRPSVRSTCPGTPSSCTAAARTTCASMRPPVCDRARTSAQVSALSYGREAYKSRTAVKCTSEGSMELGLETRLTLLAAGLLFLLALGLGVWKYRQMATTADHLAHPYVDIAHRAS